MAPIPTHRGLEESGTAFRSLGAVRLAPVLVPPSAMCTAINLNVFKRRVVACWLRELYNLVEYSLRCL